LKRLGVDKNRILKRDLEEVDEETCSGSQDSYRWCAAVVAVMKILVPLNADNFLTR
jgi:hypothetical protein